MKIVFIDIDGTLIDLPNGMSKASKETKRVLKDFRSSGNLVIIASARVEVPNTLNDLEIDGFIGCDGHYIEFHNEVFVNDLFSQEEVEKQIEVIRNNGGDFIFGGKEGTWVNDANAPLVKKHNLIYAGSEIIPESYAVWESRDINAISCTALFNDAQSLIRARKALPSDWAIEMYETGHIRMDIHLQGFSKGTACEYLYKKLNINREDTYGFGDGSNDIEMLKLVGCGVAMGSASELVKASSDYVTESVQNDGIAKAFDSLKINN